MQVLLLYNFPSQNKPNITKKDNPCSEIEQQSVSNKDHTYVLPVQFVFWT